MKNKQNVQRKPVQKQPITQQTKAPRRFTLRLPLCLVFTLAVWVWAWIYYGSFFEVSREYSFWSTDTRLLQFFMCRPFAPIRYVGRALLCLFRYPWLGAALLAFLLGSGSVLMGYILRLPVRWRALQFVPALIYMAVLTKLGLDAFFESETGFILGIPFTIYVALAIIATVMWLVQRRPLPHLWHPAEGETVRANWLQLGALILAFAGIITFDQMQRPYVRTICRMMMYSYQQDWEGVQRVARANAEQSNRIISTYYAAALIHTDQIGDRIYDIRLEYDTLHLHSMDGGENTGLNMYLQEGNYHGGLTQTCYHSCMEQMVMEGPNLRLLKLMTKCALMRSEWELARKYLYILGTTPFEGDFCQKYSAMVGNNARINADKEMAKLRELEPLMDTFESQHQNPTFMGYYLNLTLGRSMAAWNNSMAVCLYTKLLPQFAAHLDPYIGKTLPENFADGALLASRQFPQILDAFPNLKWRASQLDAYIASIQPYMNDRPKYGPLLFPKQKGYYPHYYFFGNLRATKPGYTGQKNWKPGVN